LSTFAPTKKKSPIFHTIAKNDSYEYNNKPFTFEFAHLIQLEYVMVYLYGSNHETTQMKQEEKQQHQKSRINCMLMSVQKHQNLPV